MAWYRMFEFLGLAYFTWHIFKFHLFHSMFRIYFKAEYYDVAVYTTFCWTTHPSIFTWAAPSLWLLWIILLMDTLRKHLFGPCAHLFCIWICILIQRRNYTAFYKCPNEKEQNISKIFESRLGEKVGRELNQNLISRVREFQEEGKKLTI